MNELMFLNKAVFHFPFRHTLANFPKLLLSLGEILAAILKCISLCEVDEGSLYG